MSLKTGGKSGVIIFHSAKYWSVLKPNATPDIIEAFAMIRARNGINANFVKTSFIGFSGPKSKKNVKEKKIEFEEFTVESFPRSERRRKDARTPVTDV